ncbi:dual specificity protein phosphatase family protein [Ralstonia sp. 25C]|uniref:dual specificity protein phosphatase family protein n=1 Tax=Ralstonia sp. 25C TaxID=3447363 RepID=UPI003F75456C
MRILAVATAVFLFAGVLTFGSAESTPAPAPRPLQWAQNVPESPVSNLHRITPSLYRSAQLSKDDVPQLQKLGIKKVISFRAFHSDSEILAGSGITLQRIPINTWNIRDTDMVTALKALRALDHEGPVLIHCQHGADRTGLVSALYRVVYQGWTKEQALEELQHGGYGFHAIWQNITHYLQRVDIEQLRRQVES